MPALRRIRDARLVAIADPVLERCNEIAPGIPAYVSAQALLTAGGVDAIVLATPAAAHFDDARLTSAAGLPTLVEKPPGADLEQAVAIARLCPPPWIGFTRRFNPRIQRLRAKIPRDGFLDLTLEQYHDGSWRPYVVRDDVLMRIGPHHFDLVRWLTRSEITRVRAVDLDTRSVSLELELERGRARVRFGDNRHWRDSIEVRKTDGILIARNGPEGLARRALSRLVRGGANSLVHLLVRELEEFIQAARGRPAPSLATANDGVPVMAAIEAARKSAEDGGRWLPLAMSD